VAYIYSRLLNWRFTEIDVLPHRCRWHDDQAKICIEQSSDGWHIGSNPVMLFDGVYRLPTANNQSVQELNQDHDAVVSETNKLVV